MAGFRSIWTGDPSPVCFLYKETGQSYHDMLTLMPDTMF
jgi:hypothetical protein